ncbi:histidine phosphatase family protein [Alkalihalobacillus sp. BA299]|uniref:histidine phosphatase family protein n=1 Tax=Alkalihalobacillus sp. BA299 TaxID=2815938 RepID=UPI001ADC1D29|nr:histidine phosphatase family protein [Alkalihalobacillus sp. BA299]
MDRRMVVTLLRHGLTDYNEEKKYLGWADIPLNEKGRERLYFLKQNYIYPKADLVVSSNLIRCVTTAEILYPNHFVKKDSSLREIHFGDWEGQTYEQLKGDPLYREWLNNPYEVVPPNGEAFLHFRSRILESWNNIVTDAIDHSVSQLVVVSHGGPIRFILSYYASIKKDFWEWNVAYGQGYSLCTDVDRIRRGERWNLLQEAPFTEKESGSIHTIK